MTSCVLIIHNFFVINEFNIIIIDQIKIIMYYCFIGILKEKKNFIILYRLANIVPLAYNSNYIYLVSI